MNNPGLDQEAKIPADVATIEANIHAAYDVISGPAGQARDWNRERSLLIPGARLIPTTARPGVAPNPPPQGFGVTAEDQGTSESWTSPATLDVEGYIARVEPCFTENGFFEKEIARRAERFGRIAHVWSTYEARHQLDDPEPFMRGINSFQLLYDGRRWWIVTIYWQHESPERPIPEKYLTTVERRTAG